MGRQQQVHVVEERECGCRGLVSAGGVAAVRDYIQPAQPLQTAPEILDLMGWTAEEYSRAGVPAYPNLIDEKHIVAELYNMNNVPMSVWIDERGQIVRPV